MHYTWKSWIFNVSSDVRLRLFICPIRPNTANSHDCSAVSQCTCLWYTSRWAVSSFPGQTITYHADPASPFIISNGFTMMGQSCQRTQHTPSPSSHIVKPSSYLRHLFELVGCSLFCRMRLMALMPEGGVHGSYGSPDLLWCYSSICPPPGFFVCVLPVHPSSSSLIHISLSLSFHLSEFWNGCLRV